MARDEGLEEMLHGQFGATPGLSESSMFGGRAWLPGASSLDNRLNSNAGSAGVYARARLAGERRS